MSTVATVEAHVIDPGTRAADEVLSRIGAAPTAEPFAESTCKAFEALSHRLLHGQEARSFPDVAAVGYWIRGAAVRRMAEMFASRIESDTLRVAQGTVFHIPPSNVDTLFLYSWLVAALMGNRSVVRLPSVSSEQFNAVLGILQDVLGAPEGQSLGARSAFVRYGHDPAITEAFSRGADVRAIWGGDATVATIRSIPTSPLCRDLVFGDRASLSVFDAATVLDAGQDELHDLAARSFRDAYWYDQAACSSPRLWAFRGTRDQIRGARDRLLAALLAHIEAHAYEVPTGLSLNKRTYAFGRVADGRAQAVEFVSNELVAVDVENPTAQDLSDHCGGGLFLVFGIQDLAELAPVLDRRVQTLTHHGFGAAELHTFATLIAGSGVDRIVPVGEALAFSHRWDGYDLFDEFTRLVHIRERA